MAGIASECCSYLFIFFAGGSARKLGLVKLFSGQENTGPRDNSPASYAGYCLRLLLLFSTVSYGLQMLSSESHEELETLLNMEMKLRLLDLENISIPGTPPPIPTDPPNFDFVYDFS